MSAFRATRSIILCALATFVLTAADLWSKAWAEQALSKPRTVQVSPACMPDSGGYYSMQRLRSNTVVLVSGYLELRYAENCGAAFGMLDEAPRWLRVFVFMTAGVLAIVALGTMFVRGSGGTLFAVSVPLVVSGALGNMVDRVRLGYVIDFIHFHIHEAFPVAFLRGFEWPTFNVADSTITVGVALLLLDGFRKQTPAGESAKGDAAVGTGKASAKQPT